MELPLGVQVHCTDGRCGRSTYVILNPTNDEITHLVVRERQPSRIEHLVPVSWVATSAAEVILLGHTKKEFLNLEQFNQKEFIYTDLPHHATDPKLTLLWPYTVPAKRVVDSQIRPIPPGQLAVRRGARVRATDGPVGKIDEFIVDSEKCYITHLVLREGNLLGKKYVTIPVSEIDQIEEKVVHLKIDKERVAEMPTVQVKRSWT
jgi:sporulation protein YlmC with PRC-barrel domain